MTRGALGRIDERARQASYPADWRRSDQQIEQTWRNFLSSRTPPSDLWVFAYASLMWDPGFHYAEIRLADIVGYQRRFTVKAEAGRGSPGRPALAMSLEQQPGRCRGLVFRIAADLVEAETEILWRRELMVCSYIPTMELVATPQGSVTAVVFASDTSDPKYVGELPLHETAAIIARGEGTGGTNRAYLEQIVDGLKAIGVEDPYVEQVLEQVNMIAPS